MISQDEVDRIGWEELRRKKGTGERNSAQTGQIGMLERQVERIAGYLRIIAAVLVIELAFGVVGILIALIAL